MVGVLIPRDASFKLVDFLKLIITYMYYRESSLDDKHIILKFSDIKFES